MAAFDRFFAKDAPPQVLVITLAAIDRLPAKDAPPQVLALAVMNRFLAKDAPPQVLVLLWRIPIPGGRRKIDPQLVFGQPISIT